MKIVLIDDHKIILEGYKAILISKAFEVKENIKLLNSLSSAYEYIQEQFKKSKSVDIFIIDYAMPPCSKYNLNDGTDLIRYIKKNFPNAKIVLLSSLSSSLLMFDIIKKVEPDGFWLKTEIDDEILINYINAVCGGETIYSKSIHKSYELVLNYANELDEHNRKILLLLDQGVKTK